VQKATTPDKYATRDKTNITQQRENKISEKLGDLSVTLAEFQLSICFYFSQIILTR